VVLHFHGMQHLPPLHTPPLRHVRSTPRTPPLAQRRFGSESTFRRGGSAGAAVPGGVGRYRWVWGDGSRAGGVAAGLCLSFYYACASSSAERPRCGERLASTVRLLLLLLLLLLRWRWWWEGGEGKGGEERAAFYHHHHRHIAARSAGYFAHGNNYVHTFYFFSGVCGARTQGAGEEVWAEDI